MHSRLPFLIVLTLLCAGTAGRASAGVILIDDFCSGPQSLSGPGTPSSEVAAPSIPQVCSAAIGGVRYADYAGNPGATSR